jgi:hypothetical protein
MINIILSSYQEYVLCIYRFKNLLNLHVCLLFYLLKYALKYTGLVEILVFISYNFVSSHLTSNMREICQKFLMNCAIKQKSYMH